MTRGETRRTEQATRHPTKKTTHAKGSDDIRDDPRRSEETRTEMNRPPGKPDEEDHRRGESTRGEAIRVDPSRTDTTREEQATRHPTEKTTAKRPEATGGDSNRVDPMRIEQAIRQIMAGEPSRDLWYADCRNYMRHSPHDRRWIRVPTRLLRDDSTRNDQSRREASRIETNRLEQATRHPDEEDHLKSMRRDPNRSESSRNDSKRHDSSGTGHQAPDEEDHSGDERTRVDERRVDVS